MPHDEDEEHVKCRNENCGCLIHEEEVYCSERCRKAAKSERPSSYECKCDHDECEDDE